MVGSPPTSAVTKLGFAAGQVILELGYDDDVDDDDVLERVAKRKSISHEPLARMERPAEASPSPRAVMADEPAGERT